MLTFCNRQPLRLIWAEDLSLTESALGDKISEIIACSIIIVGLNKEE